MRFQDSDVVREVVAEEVIVNEGILGKRRECIGKPLTREQITKRVREILSS